MRRLEVVNVMAGAIGPNARRCAHAGANSAPTNRCRVAEIRLNDSHPRDFVEQKRNAARPSRSLAAAIATAAATGLGSLDR